jgi:hypothetical protein
MIISCSILLKIRNGSDRSCKNQTILGSITFSENRAVYDIMWKSMVQLDRPQVKIGSTQSACAVLYCHIISSQQIFEKSSNIKFKENPLPARRVVPCGRTDMTKLIVAFHNFPKVGKNASLLGSICNLKPSVTDGLRTFTNK